VILFGIRDVVDDPKKKSEDLLVSKRVGGPIGMRDQWGTPASTWENFGVRERDLLEKEELLLLNMKAAKASQEGSDVWWERSKGRKSSRSDRYGLLKGNRENSFVDACEGQKTKRLVGGENCRGLGHG